MPFVALMYPSPCMQDIGSHSRVLFPVRRNHYRQQDLGAKSPSLDSLQSGLAEMRVQKADGQSQAETGSVVVHNVACPMWSSKNWSPLEILLFSSPILCPLSPFCSETLSEINAQEFLSVSASGTPTEDIPSYSFLLFSFLVLLSHFHQGKWD